MIIIPNIKAMISTIRSTSSGAGVHFASTRACGRRIYFIGCISASVPSPLASALTNSESDRILVLIRLKGGNDGLNTIVPIYDYNRYANLRPTLKLDESSLYHLSDDFGLPSFIVTCNLCGEMVP